MTLQKGFLKPKIQLSIPKYKYVIGVLIGLFIAISLYSLQFMTREAIRWYSISDNDLWLLSDSEVNFYNLIFAFSSVIVGQSFCFTYWFDRPAKVFNLRTGRLRSIVHEQRFLNWYFLCWFSKVATMYGFLFGMAGSGAFYMMSLYPNFNYLFILIVIVMFLQVWNTLLLTFKKRAYQWMMISMLVVSLLSYGLSKIDIIDYKTLNENVINKRLDVKHHLRLPTSNTYETTTYRYARLPTVSLVTPKGGKDSGPILFLGNKESSIEALPNKIEKTKINLAQELQLTMPIFLKVDKDVPMNYVHSVTKSLALADIQFLRYMVVPLETEYDPRYYVNHERTHLSKFNQSHFRFDYEVNLDRVKTYSNKLQIQISTGGYEINNLHVVQEDLVETLISKIEGNHDYVIVMNFNEGLTFEMYFEAISALYQAIFSLRDEESLKEYEKDFKTLKESFQRDAQLAIMSKYPLRYIEIWNGSSSQFEYNINPDDSLPEL